MYRKRSYASKKRSYTKGRGYAYKPRRSFPPRAMSVRSGDQVHAFKRPMFDCVVTTSALGQPTYQDYTGSPPGWLTAISAIADVSAIATPTLQYGWTCAPAINLIPSPGEITNLFREFRIVKLQVKITAIMGDSYNSGNGSPMPEIVSLYDPSDAVPPATYAAAIQYSNATQHRLTNDSPLIRSCIPKPAMALYASAIATGYAEPMCKQWYDSNTAAAAPFYALKFFVRGQAGGFGTGFGYRITPTLWIEARRPR